MAETERIRLGVVYGGRSGEHEVSCISARNVIRAADPERFSVVEIFIGRDGSWFVAGQPAALRLDRPGRAVFLVPGGEVVCDVLFPVLHGPYGEDGTVQGLFELLNVPYVGADVLGSAVGMDKGVQKTLLRAAGLPVVDFQMFPASRWRRDPEGVRRKIRERIGYPCFVKPTRLGSSVGIHRVEAEEELGKAVEDALQYDLAVLVERAVPQPLEVEVSVLGNDDPIASVPGEIRPTHAFYTYEAKYLDPHGAELVIPAALPRELAERVRLLALEAYRVLQLCGMARVDFLVERGGAAYVSEVNTIPGFTPISMYPKLWEASGIPYRELISRLVDLALERWRQKSALRTTYAGGEILARKEGMR
ncbi:MAG: D-alanine--D-alanine ligase family protein [Armatimonadota bacterium]|nr:D-alanine--D-alanine ligase family protein [Armatimonadota bacterium]MDR7444125.1 D-alanine--D-alanine ligase family protein [Armatimonadota bacterium]MDR7569542.1 D-alanine--D-alanine ligase family protein [Armatimonadota bacterium]MDR7613574.1 D-alanine--D-alanine ligase family protein [Armatimonadota bacterium]